MKQNFYVTTPIYYWNWIPHVWHFYSSTIANVIFNYNKISWKNARFTTWIDENSQKAVIKAEESGMSVMDYLDHMASEHQKVWDYFNFWYTDFIRTTSDRHHKLVKEVLDHCYKKWDIYQDFYEWMYCVWCESFKKDEDLVYMNKTTKETFPISDKVKPSDNIVKVCADHLTTPDTIKEKNYFFKLSKYQTWIEQFYAENKTFVNPDFRYNEVKAFVGRWLEDFSISRETNTFWITLPFDDSQVTYVWFDALFNYYTSCKYSRWGDKNNTDFVDERDFWIRGENNNDRKIIHVVWKDIIRFHAIFWPAMLASYFDLWEEIDWVINFKKSDLDYLPDQILTGWFFTVDGQKMSKTIWNVIEPIEYSEKYSKDLLTLYMLSAFSIGRDWDYDRNDAIYTYNSKMANNFWNLLNRAVVLTLKLDLENWLLSDISKEFSDDKDYTINFDWEEVVEFNGSVKWYNYYFSRLMEQNNLKWALDLTFKFLDSLNNYVTTTEPWALMKDDSKSEEVEQIMYTLCESIRNVAINLYPFFPEKMSQVFDALNISAHSEKLEEWKMQELREQKITFKITKKAPILFQKYELE